MYSDLASVGGALGGFNVMVNVILTILVTCLLCMILSCSQVRSGRALRIGDVSRGTIPISTRVEIVDFGFNFKTCDDSCSFFVSKKRCSQTFSRRSIRGGLTSTITSVRRVSTSVVTLRRISVSNAEDCRVSRVGLFTSTLSSCDSISTIGCSSSCLFCPFGDPRNTGGSKVVAFSGCNVSSTLEEDLPVRRSLVGFLSLSEYCSGSMVPTSGNGGLYFCGLRLSTCASSNAVSITRLGVLLRSVRKRCLDNGCYVTVNSFGVSLLNGSSSCFMGVRSTSSCA